MRKTEEHLTAIGLKQPYNKQKYNFAVVYYFLGWQINLSPMVYCPYYSKNFLRIFSFRTQYMNVDYKAVWNYVLIQVFLFLTAMKGASF